MRVRLEFVIDSSGSMINCYNGVKQGVQNFMTEFRLQTADFLNEDGSSVCISAFSRNPYSNQFILTKAFESTVADYTPNFDFVPSGTSPICDAVGSTLARINNCALTDLYDRVLIVLVTDGSDSESMCYSREDVMGMIQSLPLNVSVGTVTASFHLPLELGISEDLVEYFHGQPAGCEQAMGRLAKNMSSML